MDQEEIRPVKPRNVEGSSWNVRRKIIVISLIYAAIVVGYLTLYGDDNRLHESIATSMVLFAGSIIGSYVFGAVWEDRRK